MRIKFVLVLVHILFCLLFVGCADPGKKAIEVTKENFDQIAERDLVLLDFGAPWCSPCARLSPIIDRLAEKYDGRLVVGKVNVDQQESLMRQFDIRTLPTLCYLQNGELIETQTSSFTSSQIQDRIDVLLNSQTELDDADLRTGSMTLR